MLAPLLEDHDRQFSRSDSQDGTFCYQYCGTDYTFTEIATNHRLQRTMVNPLHRHEKLISEYICKKSLAN